MINKDTFGKPGEGIHQHRFLGIAIVDFGFTLLFAAIVAYFFNKNFLFISLILLLLGIVAHRYFGVRTAVDKLLF
jgi:hypothetical protein